VDPTHDTATLARAKRDGTRLGRPPAKVAVEQLVDVADLSAQAAAVRLGVSQSTLKRWRRQTTGSIIETFDKRLGEGRASRS